MNSSLMPHAVCWRQDQHLIWTMAITNAITFLSYFSICATLFYLARRTSRVIMREWAFFLTGFALFIVACGTTHLLEVVTTWIPVFWVDAWTNIITAALSGFVAIQFIRRAPDLGFSINDYAKQLSHAQNEKAQVEDSLLAARRLEEWNRMSAVVTHEINNPLTAIQNLMFLIQGNPYTPNDVKAMANQAADEVRRIGVITQSTLGFFRQDHKPEVVDIRAAAESARLLLEPILRQRDIELIIQSISDCTVTAYPMETRQVLLNLVRNACEATTQRGARVRIGIEGLADEVIVQVEDQGAGIAPAVLENLFQFGRSTKGERGNGIGLWAVKKLVTRHGGSINVVSTVGKGTIFTVRWPRQVAAENTDPDQLVSMVPAQA
ncbi:MAG TPA: HAMP domain-containing sensor histidine kinase [Terracidiphilus sp.]|jgi:signal transduction histidine kinase